MTSQSPNGSELLAMCLRWQICLVAMGVVTQAIPFRKTDFTKPEFDAGLSSPMEDKYRLETGIKQADSYVVPQILQTDDEVLWSIQDQLKHDSHLRNFVNKLKVERELRRAKYSVFMQKSHATDY